MTGRDPCPTGAPPRPAGSRPEGTVPALSAADLRDLVAVHARPSRWRATRDLALTVGPFLLLAGLLLWGIERRFWPVLVLALPAAGFLVRLFIIQHDCGHGSYFKARWANNWVGRIIGVLTLTPYAAWRRDHAAHHATSGNLDRRGVGDITTWTTREYLAETPRRRFLYRVYRHPLLLFLVGPAWQFLIRHRIPRLGAGITRESCFSVLGTNLMLAAAGAALLMTLGWESLVLGYLPVLLLAASMGVWLFYVQHQFELTYWEPQGRWEPRAAALEGSSFYDLPAPLDWMSGHIGFHALHHLASRIPSYRLRQAFHSLPAWRDAKRLRLFDSLRCARLALWDMQERKLVGFRDVGRP